LTTGGEDNAYLWPVGKLGYEAIKGLDNLAFCGRGREKSGSILSGFFDLGDRYFGNRAAQDMPHFSDDV
jgi:hypothetical protein